MVDISIPLAAMETEHCIYGIFSMFITDQKAVSKLWPAVMDFVGVEFIKPICNL